MAIWSTRVVSVSPRPSLPTPTQNRKRTQGIFVKLKIIVSSQQSRAICVKLCSRILLRTLAVRAPLGSLQGPLFSLLQNRGPRLS